MKISDIRKAERKYNELENIINDYNYLLKNLRIDFDRKAKDNVRSKYSDDVCDFFMEQCETWIGSEIVRVKGEQDEIEI